MEFPGELKKKRENSRGQLKKVELPGVFKKKPCRIFMGHTSFQGWKFVFSGISNGKVTNQKIPGCFFRKVFPRPTPTPVWIFSGITQFHSIVYVFLCLKIMLFVILLGSSKNILPVYT